LEKHREERLPSSDAEESVDEAETKRHFADKRTQLRKQIGAENERNVSEIRKRRLTELFEQIRSAGKGGDERTVLRIQDRMDQYISHGTGLIQEQAARWVIENRGGWITDASRTVLLTDVMRNVERLDLKERAAQELMKMTPAPWTLLPVIENVESLRDAAAKKLLDMETDDYEVLLAIMQYVPTLRTEAIERLRQNEALRRFSHGEHGGSVQQLQREGVDIGYVISHGEALGSYRTEIARKALSLGTPANVLIDIMVSVESLREEAWDMFVRGPIGPNDLENVIRRVQPLREQGGKILLLRNPNINQLALVIEYVDPLRGGAIQLLDGIDRNPFKYGLEWLNYPKARAIIGQKLLKGDLSGDALSQILRNIPELRLEAGRRVMKRARGEVGLRHDVDLRYIVKYVPSLREKAGKDLFDLVKGSVNPWNHADLMIIADFVPSLREMANAQAKQYPESNDIDYLLAAYSVYGME